MFRRIALLLAFFTVAQVAVLWADDEIYLRGKGKTKGIVTAESVKGVETKAGEKFAESDIDDIFYDTSAKVELTIHLAYKSGFTAESVFFDTTKDAKARKAKFDEAKAKYETAYPGMTDKRAKTQIEYKLGALFARKALEDGTDAKPAIVRLSEFVKANPQSWQVIRALRTLAKLQVAAKDHAGAKASYMQLSKLDVADEIKQDALLQIAMSDVQLGQYAAAEPQLAALLKTMPKESPIYARTLVVQAECLIAGGKVDDGLAILKKTTKETTDKSLKAAAYNTLGVAFYNADKYKEARWEFLWVDVVYNQDKAEHAKALYYLTMTLEKLGDAVKAEECRDQLLNDKNFAGTDFQRKMQKEKAK